VKERKREENEERREVGRIGEEKEKTGRRRIFLATISGTIINKRTTI